MHQNRSLHLCSSACAGASRHYRGCLAKVRPEITTPWVKMLLASVKIDGTAFGNSLIERIHILLALCLYSLCYWKALPVLLLQPQLSSGGCFVVIYTCI